MRHLYILFLFCLSANISVFSQQTEDAVVPISATVDLDLPEVTLNWELNGATADLLLFRREKDADTWFVLIDSAGADITSYVDPAVAVGQTYEYGIVRVVGGTTAFGYITVSLDAPVVDSRGTMLVFVEEALQTPLAFELQRLEYDLVGDGWKVNWHPVSPSANVATVKNEIVSAYNSDPTGVKSVLLLGEIPVPYSGNTAWDGHGDHQGAWPADTYYGDMDGVWTDAIVNNTTPSRPANDNVPGDGKFDHSIAPSATELAVGRVDFSNLNETTFGTTRTELMRRYLNKNHKWRTKQYTVSNKAMVDDNFGYFGGEAFAANGYRNYYPIVGVDSVMDAHFFTDTKDQSFLFGYGCGGGSYTSASGVGNSGNFASDTVNVVFSMIFGSYHGDWDSENNPFMVSALASEGGILSCSWAGRPHWFYHSMAAGETLGYGALATQNSCDNAGYFGSFGECGAHVTLLGDPSLRAHVVAPVGDLSANNKCFSTDLTWDASTSDNLSGYLVFRSASLSGDFERLTPSPISETNFTDNAPLVGDNYYQVRAVALETTPSGSYFNSSTGAIIHNVFQTGTPPDVDIVAETLSCLNATATIASTTNASQPVYSWTGPGGFTSSDSEIEVSVIGLYTLTVTDGISGCSQTESITLVQDSSLPSADPSANGIINCVSSVVQLFANPDMGGYTFLWTGPANFTSGVQNPTTSVAGLYTLTVTAGNGCSAVFSVEVNENTDVPIAQAIGGTITCNNPIFTLDGTGSSTGPNIVYQWSTSDGNIVSGGNTLTPVVDECGTYTLSIVNTMNGCFSMTSTVVDCDLEVPDLSIEGDFQVSCAGDEVEVTATSTTPGATFYWEGPGIFDPTNPTQQLTNFTYNLTVIGPNGCTTSQNLQITGPDVLNVVLSTILLDCDGFSHVDALVTGGTSPYSYTFSPMPPFPPSTNYQVVVTDANGCSSEISGTTPDYQPIAISIDHTDETVFGFNDGSATANILNGVFPISYLWSNGATTQTITGLAPGVYTVIATDANGCEITATIEIMPGANSVLDISGVKRVDLFPNPTAGDATLSIELETSMRISVAIVNLIGQQIQVLPDSFTDKHTFDLDLSQLAPGIYFCKIQIGEYGETSLRLVKI